MTTMDDLLANLHPAEAAQLTATLGGDIALKVIDPAGIPITVPGVSHEVVPFGEVFAIEPTVGQAMIAAGGRRARALHRRPAVPRPGRRVTCSHAPHPKGTAMPAPPTRPRASSGPVELHLLDEIGTWGVTAAAFIGQLRDAAGRDVVLHISSPGGDLVDGLAMHHALRAYSGHTTAHITALCASAATVVALGCDDRVTAPGAQWMCHRPWVGTVGDIDDHRAAVDVLSRFGTVLNDLYAERAGGTAAEWDRITAAETWFSADESVTAGLSHRVGNVVPVEAAARRRLQALRADYRGRGRVAAAVRTATAHGLVAAARRARTPNVAELVRQGVHDALRPNLAELVAAGVRDGVR